MQNQIIDVTYNNEAISVNRDASLEQLLRIKKLMKCPISVWTELFTKKDGHVSEYVLKEVLKHQVINFDSSDNVNSFLMKNQKYWLDKSTRVGLQQLVNSSDKEVSLVLGDEILTVSKDIASKFLALLEVYAGQCFIQTQKHLNAIKELKTVEDIINYDYTKGYPEKIIFNV